MQEIQAQQAKLSKLESEWKFHETQMMVEMKQKQAEAELRLEEKTRPKMMQLDLDVKWSQLESEHIINWKATWRMFLENSVRLCCKNHPSYELM